MPLSSVVGAQSIVKPGVCTSSTRPASPYEGQMIYETDTDILAIWNGSSWRQLAAATKTGSVLQVVQGTLSSLATSNSSTVIDSGLSATITPQSTANKVLVTVSIQWQKSGANSNNGLFLYLVRGSTTIQPYGLIGYTGTALQNIGSATMTFLDSPSTTSATTYKLQFANYFNGGSVYISSDGSTSTITLQEIAG